MNGMPEVEAKTIINHSQIINARVGERIVINAKISDDDGIDVDRVYFKWQTAADSYVIPMYPDGSTYVGKLTIPADAGSIEYLLLIKSVS